jgi:hypothetical protein
MPTLQKPGPRSSARAHAAAGKERTLRRHRHPWGTTWRRFLRLWDQTQVGANRAEILLLSTRGSPCIFGGSSRLPAAIRSHCAQSDLKLKRERFCLTRSRIQAGRATTFLSVVCDVWCLYGMGRAECLHLGHKLKRTLGNSGGNLGVSCYEAAGGRFASRGRKQQRKSSGSAQTRNFVAIVHADKEIFLLSLSRARADRRTAKGQPLRGRPRGSGHCLRCRAVEPPVSSLDSAAGSIILTSIIKGTRNILAHQPSHSAYNPG